jgi:hypothetical protein
MTKEEILAYLNDMFHENEENLTPEQKAALDKLENKPELTLEIIEQQ